MRLTKAKRAELKALAEKATPGEWHAWVPKRSEITAHQRYTISRADPAYSHPDMEAVVASCYGDGSNAAFIAASRQALPDALADIEELEAKLGQAEKDRQSSRKALDETMGWLMRCATSVGWQLGQPLGEAFKNGDALQSKLAEAVKALEGVKLELNDGCNSLDTTVSARRVEAFIDAALAKVRA